MPRAERYLTQTWLSHPFLGVVGSKRRPSLYPAAAPRSLRRVMTSAGMSRLRPPSFLR